MIAVLGYFFAWTWFIWPAVFVCSLICAIRNEIKRPENEVKHTINYAMFWAALSFTLIVGGLMFFAGA